MSRFEVDVLTTTTVTYEIIAKTEEEARTKWATLGFTISKFVEVEEVMDVRAVDDRFVDDEELTDEYEEDQLEVDE